MSYRLPLLSRPRRLDDAALVLAALVPALLFAEPTDAAAKAGASAADAIAAYRAEANDVNKAEVKASLERLDAEIELLKVKIDAVTDTARKDELRGRFRALKERRNELSGEFRQARYDALLADVKAEWERLIN